MAALPDEPAAERVPFRKYHALGNDFVVIDARTRPDLVDDADLARDLLDRHAGAGADDCIFVTESAVADVRMRIRTPAGSWLSMCGNGIRCLARYLHDVDPSMPQALTIETDVGLRRTRWLDSGSGVVEADLDEPDLQPTAIPTTLGNGNGPVLNQPLDLGGPGMVLVSCVSVGNPHAVIFAEDLQTADMQSLGAAVERHPAFPNGVNVHAAQILGLDRARIVTWERGAGLTLA